MSLPMPHPGPALPATDAIRMNCQQCGRHVRVHVARDFVRAIKQLCLAAGGIQLPPELSALTYRCEGGHIVVIPVAKLGLAS